VTAPADRWRSSRRGWAITTAVLAATVCLACWPRPTLGVLGIVVGTGALLTGIRGLLAEHRGQAPAEPSDDLTAQEARDLADDLSLQLYRAADALDFVRECCDIADREGRQPTTAAVREWLRGAQCARQAGLVLSPAQGGAANESGERCCVCGGPETPYENYRGQLFCWPCADCPCGETPCVRTGINDPAVSSAAAEGRTCQCAGVGFGGRGDCPVHDGPTTADASGRAPETARPQLLGGVGLLEETAPTTVQVTPPLTGPMPATDTPTCGTNLPSTDGIPCGEPAAWHIRWAPGAPGDATFPAGLACHAHMEQLARAHAWHERHEAGPDCGTRTATWTPERCTEAP
jgi:hypothetical protein